MDKPESVLFQFNYMVDWPYTYFNILIEPLWKQFFSDERKKPLNIHWIEELLQFDCIEKYVYNAIYVLRSKCTVNISLNSSFSSSHQIVW